MFTETILALMLLIGPGPGKSLYSSVDTTEDARPVVIKKGVYVELEEGEELPYSCKQKTNVACRRVRYHKPRKSWIRTETYEQGMHRYWMIARAISKHAKGDMDVAMRLIVTSRHESGWWRDIQAGYNHQPYKHYTKMEDGGASWGLFQLLVGHRKSSKIRGTDLTIGEIIGVTDEATGKAVKVATWHFSTIVKRCTKRGGGPTCWWMSYGGVKNPRDKRIASRVSSWARLKRSKPKARKLDATVRKLLGLKTEK